MKEELKKYLEEGDLYEISSVFKNINRNGVAYLMTVANYCIMDDSEMTEIIKRIEYGKVKNEIEGILCGGFNYSSFVSKTRTHPTGRLEPATMEEAREIIYEFINNYTRNIPDPDYTVEGRNKRAFERLTYNAILLYEKFFL
jgi:hypothetical protein